MILYVINLSLSQTLSLSQSDKKQSVLKRERETLFYARARLCEKEAPEKCGE